MSVRLGILGLIKQKPRHGYELHAAFTALIGGKANWEVKPAQVYTTISRLEKADLIAQERSEKDGGPEKTIYVITEKGKVELDKWLVTPVETQHVRDEFYLKLMLAIATEEELPFPLIYTQRTQLLQELHRINRDKRSFDAGTELALLLLMEQTAMRIEADLRWLDMVEGRLDDIQKQPLPEPTEKLRGRPSHKGAKED